MQFQGLEPVEVTVMSKAWLLNRPVSDKWLLCEQMPTQ